MSLPQPAIRTSAVQHSHISGDRCPYCDQEIANEKAAEIKARVERDDQRKTDAITARLNEQFTNERAQIEANARAVLEQSQRESAARVEAVKAESIQREAIARALGAKEAQANSQKQIAALTQVNVEQATAAKEQIEKSRREKAEAEQAKIAAEFEAKQLRENAEAVLNARLQEQRDALEKDKQAAVLAEQRKIFDEKQKLQSTVHDLQRQLVKERADVLGEGAELDLFEELRAAFEGDRIRRVPKGAAGADVIHEIVVKGQVCGKIVYDAKNRTSWRSDYATKLCEYKVAEGAQHAVLSLLKFPSDAKQLDCRDGVILANPARVVAIAEILRDHVIHTNGLRVSNEEREKKKGALYAYITSERFNQHLDAIESQTEKILGVDVDEQRAHRTVWEKRGKLLKGLQKSHGNLSADVSRILGTEGQAE